MDFRVLSAPVFVKIMTIVVAMALLLGVCTTWIFHVSWGRHERMEVRERGLRLATHLAAMIGPLLRNGNRADAQRMVSELSDIEPEANRVLVTDLEGRVIASRPVVNPAAPTRAVTAPLMPGPSGFVTVDVSEAEVAIQSARFTRRMAGALAFITCVGVCAIWIVVRLVTRPIQELAVRVRAVKAGDYRAGESDRVRDEVGELAAAFNDLTAALKDKQAANRGLLQKVIESAENERKRVARELHDGTGQALTSLIAGLAALETGGGGERAGELRAQAVQALTDVHDLALTLRPDALDDLGLVPALKKYCRAASQRFGVSIGCETVGLDDATRLPGEIEVALYRIGQEALMNAVRHGQAKSVEVLLQRKAASLLTVVQDNGRGFDASDWNAQCRRQDRLGLLGIEERAALLGGTLRVESHPGNGTSLFVEIPLMETAHA